MRTALLLSLLLAGSALALVPSAAASPPCQPEGPCPPQPQPLPTVDCRKVPDRQPLLVVTDDCYAIVTLDLFSCPFGEETVTAQVGRVTVHRDQCTPCGGACPPPADSTAMADPFPTCVRECSPLPMEACEVRDLTPGPLLHPLWGYDCTLDVETSCLGGASDSTDARIGFVNVSLAKCDGPDWS